jgi:hypothetical protein
MLFLVVYDLGLCWLRLARGCRSLISCGTVACERRIMRGAARHRPAPVYGERACLGLERNCK